MRQTANLDLVDAIHDAKQQHVAAAEGLDHAHSGDEAGNAESDSLLVSCAPMSTEPGDFSDEEKASRFVKHPQRDHEPATMDTSMTRPPPEGARLQERRQLQMMSIEEYRQAAVDEAKLLIAIDGVVYDVTQFASRHPGGEAPLRRHSGSTGASDAFHAVGHSASATALMHQFAVAVLPATEQTESLEQRKQRIEAALREEGTASIERPYSCLLTVPYDRASPGASEFLRCSMIGLAVNALVVLSSPSGLPMDTRAPAFIGSQALSSWDTIRVDLLMRKLRLPEWCIVLWVSAVISHVVNRQRFLPHKGMRNSARLEGRLLCVLFSPTCHLHAIVALVAHIARCALCSHEERAASLLTASTMLIPMSVALWHGRLATSRGACALAMTFSSVLLLLCYDDRPQLQSVMSTSVPVPPYYGRTAYRFARVLVGALLTLLQDYFAEQQTHALPQDSKALHLYLCAAYLSAMVRWGSPTLNPFGSTSALLPMRFADVLSWLGLLIGTLASFGVLVPIQNGTIPWAVFSEVRVLAIGSVGLLTAVSRNELSEVSFGLLALLLK